MDVSLIFFCPADHVLYLMSNRQYIASSRIGIPPLPKKQLNVTMETVTAPVSFVPCAVISTVCRTLYTVIFASEASF